MAEQVSDISNLTSLNLTSDNEVITPKEALEQAKYVMNSAAILVSLANENEALRKRNEYLEEQHEQELATNITLRNVINNTTSTYSSKDIDPSDFPTTAICTHDRPRLEFACKYLESKNIDLNNIKRGKAKDIAAAMSAITGIGIDKCGRYLSERKYTPYDNQKTRSELIEYRDSFGALGIECPI